MFTIELGKIQKIACYIRYQYHNAHCEKHDLGFSWWWRFKSWSSGLHHVMMQYDTSISEGNAASLKMEAALPSKTFVSYHSTTQCHKPEDHSMNSVW